MSRRLKLLFRPMTKLPRVRAVDLMKLLEKNGFLKVRQSGSHIIYRNEKGQRATVPFHGAKIIHPKITKQVLETIKISQENQS